MISAGLHGQRGFAESDHQPVAFFLRVWQKLAKGSEKMQALVGNSQEYKEELGSECTLKDFRISGDSHNDYGKLKELLWAANNRTRKNLLAEPNGHPMARLNGVRQFARVPICGICNSKFAHYFHCLRTEFVLR